MTIDERQSVRCAGAGLWQAPALPFDRRLLLHARL